MEETAEMFMEVKPEPEDPVDYPLPEVDVVACALDIDIPTDSQRANQYCRLCLREVATLFPLMSRVQNILIPDMIAAVTGININMRDNLPKKVCIQCLVKLDYAYHIRLDFAESHRILKLLAKSRTVKLWECLRDYQKGVRAKIETRSEKLLRENKDIIRMRLIKKEEQLANMTGEELINVDLPKTIPTVNAKKSTETILDQEQNEMKNECSLDDKMEELEDTKQTSKEIVNSDSSKTKCETESEEESSNQVQVKKKVSDKKSASEGPRISRILNYKVVLNETDFDPNKCYICLEQFPNVEDLELHLPNHREMVPYDCEECKGTPIETPISTVIMLHRHVRMHTGSIKCPECPYRCFKGYGLYTHLKRYHLQDSNTDCTCEICGVKIKNKRSLETHMRAHRRIDEGRYTCSFCAKKFSTNTRLQRHERIHTNEKPYRCRYCDKSFNNDTSFQAHERSHTGVRGYRCKECDKGYRTRTFLNKHLETAHKIGARKQPKKPSSPPPPFDTPKKCTFEGCNFETDAPLEYQRHKAKHALKFQCPHCDGRFPYKHRLVSHELLVHTNVKSHCCDLCGQTFRYRKSFDDHMANHNNIRKYSCEICNTSFVRSGNLKEHMKKHSDTLDYACRHCGKKFRYRADCFKHEKTHQKEEILTKEEVDLDCSDVMDVIAEEYDEESLIVEYLDE